MKKIGMMIAAGLLMASCSNRPKGVLSDSKMEDLMVDLLIAEAYSQSTASDPMPDSIRNKLGEAVLVKHGVDRATLDSTYNWYAENMDDYYKLYDNVNRRLSKLRTKTGGASFDNSSNNLWQLPRHILFSPLAKSDVLVFELPSEGITRGDVLEWKMRFSSPVDATAMIGVDYSDNAGSIAESRLQSDRTLSITFQTDTAREVKRIFGSIRVKRSSMPAWADSIRIIKTPFDSMKYYNGISHQRMSMGPRKRTVVKDTTSLQSQSDGKTDTIKSQAKFVTPDPVQAKESSTMLQQKRTVKSAVR